RGAGWRWRRSSWPPRRGPRRPGRDGTTRIRPWSPSPARSARPGAPTTSRPGWPASPPAPGAANATARCRPPAGAPPVPPGVRAYLDGAPDGDGYAPDGFFWVTGPQQLAAWVAARFARDHRIVPDSLRVTRDTVAWRYQELLDAVQVALGIAPLDGDAEAVVR